ncbi:hypothetical protein VCHA53O466_50223 [Vibrio chagasii]|nr:hypothetical protein VCHA53O466_50223 [Vibrio chagasii]
MHSNTPSYLEESSKHNSVDAWANASPQAFVDAIDSGHLDECLDKFPLTDIQLSKLRASGLTLLERVARKRLALKSKQASQDEGKQGKVTWTLSLCQKESAKYPTHAQWSAKSHSSYRAALREGWLKRCKLKKVQL